MRIEHRTNAAEPPTNSGGAVQGNRSVRAGLEWLCRSGIPFQARCPDSEIDAVVEEATAAVASGALETL
jgi:hypothetical protein